MLAKQKKRNTIIQSALKLFSTKGFYNTTISEISEQMGVSVGNIYNYFPSKKSLAQASIRYVTNKLATELRYINSLEISQKEKIRHFVTVYLQFVHRNPEMIEYFFKVYLSNRELFCDKDDCGFALAKEFIDEVEFLVEKGVSEGEFEKIDFYMAFSLVTGILGSITFLNSENAFMKDLNTYIDDVSTLICKGLSR